ncbi:MAG TPA: hypothetical protein PKH16_10030 [Aequorivita sp.]|nr:hypothetical protein [Aequorivita sp.]
MENTNLPPLPPKSIAEKTYKDFVLEDEKTLLATIAAQNNLQNQHLNRIKNNVVFFFWLLIVQFIFALIALSIYSESSNSYY